MQAKYGESWKLTEREAVYDWSVPDTQGMSIFKLGYQIQSDQRFDGTVVLKEIDWDGAPTAFAQRGMLMNSIWNTNPLWLAGFASSAVQFAADFKQTYCVSHVEDGGLVTIGSREWSDYAVESTVYYSLHREGGLVARSVGHRRYYGAVLSGYKKAQIIMEKDGQRTVLGETDYPYQEDEGYRLRLELRGNVLSFSINGEKQIEVEDDTYTRGGAGFMISRGTMTCNSFIVSEAGGKL